MRGYGRKLLASLIAVLLALFAPILASEPAGSKRFAAPAEEIIACRVLDDTARVTVWERRSPPG